MTDEMDKHYLVVEKAVEHEDGSATYTFDMSNDTRDMFVSDGVRLTLMCAAAEISVEDAFDMIHDIVKGKLDESQQDAKGETKNDT
jgi:hypothetical protein